MMRILTFMGLGNKKCADKLLPLSSLEHIEKIYVLRNRIGPSIPKVVYLTPKSKFWTFNIVFYYIWRIFKAFIVIPKINPDLITSYYYFPHGMLANFFGCLYKKKVINSIIGTDLMNRLIGKVYSPLLRKLISKSKIITVTGSKSKEILLNKGIPKDKLKILSNSIDTESFSPFNYKKEYDFIFIGSLLAVKQIDKIIQFCNIFISKYDKENFRLAIVGEGKERKNLEKLTKELNITNNIEFLGFREDIIHLINKSKFLILLSKSEGFPAAVLEAMCCGVVPIVSNVGDISDICIHRFNSILIENDEIMNSKNTDIIINLLDGSAELSRLSQNALNTGNDYDYSKTSNQWKRILKRS